MKSRTWTFTATLLGAAFMAHHGFAQSRTADFRVDAVASVSGGDTMRFLCPYGVAVDGAGTIFVADEGLEMIWRVSPSGLRTAIAGFQGAAGSVDGTGAAARFAAPRGVAVGETGTVFVADAGNCTIRKISPMGVVTTLAGMANSHGSADGRGSAARFDYPQGIALDGIGNLYVVEQLNHTLRKVTPTGVVTTLAGLAGHPGSADGTGNTARFSRPIGVAVDSWATIYVADSENHTLRKVTPTGVVTTLAGLAGHPGAVDGAGVNARFNTPFGVAVDHAGKIYVADAATHIIRKITPLGQVTTLAGLAGRAGDIDGIGAAARFAAPSGLAADTEGNIYVADNWNATIRKVTNWGMVTRFAGIGSTVREFKVSDVLTGGAALANHQDEPQRILPKRN